jgi:hypothetical protein
MDTGIVLLVHGLLFLGKLAKVDLYLQKNTVGREHQTLLQIGLAVVIGERFIGLMNIYLKRERLAEFGLLVDLIKSDVHLVLSLYTSLGEQL